jgi:glycosyltransferase involved in cell wall biosynthesis
VASDLEGTKEALGETGVFFKSGSAYDLRDKLLTLIMDASLRARMGDLAKARYLRNFRAEEMGRRVEGLYKDALLSS